MSLHRCKKPARIQALAGYTFYYLEPLVSDFTEGRLVRQVGGQLGGLRRHPAAQEGEGEDGG